MGLRRDDELGSGRWEKGGGEGVHGSFWDCPLSAKVTNSRSMG